VCRVEVREPDQLLLWGLEHLRMTTS
jgi:hypothetical protein